ncbi:hypothetical protein [Vibrio anguillarum]|uniref:Uncharacterized protein n=1 Tax=Vibrio anguillarum TaxID=55601 RepID=A0AAW4BLI2_VIBAN|nr:hypothetical protein [Vibrio anguillarum]MBF4374995.1 hypothetical protein [Vibrio anguillarum]MBF4436548.1 hypothetical protein [Vibrio anguillarum]
MSLISASKENTAKRIDQKERFNRTYNNTKERCKKTVGSFQNTIVNSAMLKGADHETNVDAVSDMKKLIMSKSSWSLDELNQQVSKLNHDNSINWRVERIRQSIFTGLVVTISLSDYNPTFIFKSKNGLLTCTSFTIV